MRDQFEHSERFDEAAHNAASSAISTRHDPRQAFKALVATALNVPVVAISRNTTQERSLPEMVHHIAPTATPDVRHGPKALGLCRQIARNACGMAHDGRSMREAKGLAVPEIGAASYLGVPLTTPHGLSIGALCVVDDAVRSWSAEDKAMISLLADNLSAQIDVSERLWDEKLAQEQLAAAYRRLSRYSGLRDEVSAAFLAPGRAIELRFDDLLRISCRLFGFDRASLARINCGDAHIVAAHPAIGLDKADPRTLSDKLAGVVAAGGAVLAWEDLAHADVHRKIDLRGERPGAYVGIPLTLGGTLYGVLELTRARPFETLWEEAEVAIFSVIGLFAAANIETLSQAERIRDSEVELMSALRGHSKHAG